MTFRRIATLAGLVAMFVGSAHADAVITITEETLNGTLDGGSFTVQIATDNDPVNQPEGAGSFDLDFLFSDFTGNLAGQTVTIDSFDFDVPIFGATPAGGMSFSEGDTLALLGAFNPALDLTSTPTDFFTIDFSLAAPLTEGDTFTVGFLPDVVTSDQIVGSSTNFADILGSTGTQVIGTPTAVPEPSSLLVCGLIGAGLTRRQLQKRRVRS